MKGVIEWNSLKRLSAALLLLLSSVGWSGALSADYWLIQLKLPEGNEISVERFIGYYDCRDRGIKNQDMLAAFSIRTGFVCLSTQERKEMQGAKEDATIHQLPGLDSGKVLRFYPEWPS
jgi:hypothetical protein